MTKHGKMTLAAMALALSVSSAYGDDNHRTAGTTVDPGNGLMTDGMSFQDWINLRQREGTLGNMPVRPYGRDDYVLGSPTLIITDESTLPPGFSRSDMWGERPADLIPGTVVDVGSEP